MNNHEALQKAVFEALSQDTGLAALIGAARVYDDVPPGTHPPYLVFADSSELDWSTGTEEGGEIRFAVEIWTAHRGRRQAAAIAVSVRDALAGIDTLEAPFHLVNLRFVSARFARDQQTEYFRGLLRFRAVVEGAE
ncbi:MAG: DUF3168 domain-containing protein [Pseudomonadota bacterium]|nr:DUF3168 domain-containing protein [Pseudomonadota bacterium]